MRKRAGKGSQLHKNRGEPAWLLFHQHHGTMHYGGDLGNTSGDPRREDETEVGTRSSCCSRST